MYIGLQKIKDVIDYIEDNITADLDCKTLSLKMGLSVYEFRRIFSFVIGCPISEYIRKRRLSLAALELIKDKPTDILTLAEKYGYSSQSAFTKAFGEYHGVAPTVLLKEKAEIKLFTVPKFEINISSGEYVDFSIFARAYVYLKLGHCEKFEINISSGEYVDFSIRKSDGFYINGFSEVSVITDSCCCESVWNGFYESGADKKLNTEKLYVAYRNSNENVLCTIGEKSARADGAMQSEKIPGSLWACFKLNTVEDDPVNKVYGKILYEWLPSANLKRNEDIPTVEVYPFDMSEDGFEWEICVPVYS